MEVQQDGNDAHGLCASFVPWPMLYRPRRSAARRGRCCRPNGGSTPEDPRRQDREQKSEHHASSGATKMRDDLPDAHEIEDSEATFHRH